MSGSSSTAHPPVLLLGGALCAVAAYAIALGPSQWTVYIVAAILLLVVAFFRTRLAIYLIIFSMLLSPEISLGSSVGRQQVTVRLEDLLLVLVGLAWLVRATYKKEPLVRESPLNRPIAAYASAAVVATIVSGWTGTIHWLKAALFLAKYLEYFVLYFLVLAHIRSRRDIRHFLIAAMVTCAVVSVMGAGQITSGQRVSAPFEGEVGEPNTFGGYLVLMLSLMGAFYLMTDRLTDRLKWVAFAFLPLLSLAFTLSRTSWGAALAAAGVLFYYGPRKSHLLAGGLLAALMYPLVAPAQVMDRLDYTFGQPESAGQIQVGSVRLDTSASARIESWRYGLEGWARRPLTGYGVAGFGFMDAQYVLILTETGLLGFAAFWWLALTIWQVGRNRLLAADDPFARALSLGYLAGFAAMLVHGIGANTFIIIRIMEPFWLLTALMVALPKHPEEEAAPAIAATAFPVPRDVGGMRARA